MQVYRGMDIGTAKPSPEERRRVPHHLIDIADPEDDFSVADFQRTGRQALSRLDGPGPPALVVGGSGLHFRALVDPLDFPGTDPAERSRLEAMEAAEARARLLEVDPGAGPHVDLDNPRRVVRALEIFHLTGDTPSARAARPEAAALRAYEPVRSIVVVGFDPGAGLAERISARVDRMLAAGLLAEVAGLADRLGVTAGQAVGYKELLPVVAGVRSLGEGRDAVVRSTTALAKRQRTFFGRDPRIRWLPWSDDVEARAAAAGAVFGEASWSS